MPDIKRKIQGKKFYTLYEIARDDLFELGNESIQTRRARARQIIASDKMGNDYLKATLVPDLRIVGRKKYAIQGTDIIRYLANKDDARRK